MADSKDLTMIVASQVLDGLLAYPLSVDFIADPLSAYLIMRVGSVGQDAGYSERVVEYCMVYGVAKYDEAKL